MATSPIPTRPELAALDPNRIVSPGTCRVCQCTDNNACMGGCEWIEPDLCSVCAEAILTALHLAEEAGPAPRWSPIETLRKLIAELQRLEQVNPWQGQPAPEEPSRIIMP